MPDPTDGLRTLCQPMFCGLKGRGNLAQGETLGLVLRKT